ncbi:MAG TPA: nucleoside diphosphate kinase regulator [Sphingomicrobium sp.]|nr:nucleoside diphosphate kinase regulator [Sphingomicrobium sp.]
MTNCRSIADRPQIHLLATESDLVADLALKAEHRHPVIASMLLEEIERAELHEAGTMPPGHVALNSTVAFVDEKSGQMREVRLVLPRDANIAEGRISILTPIGAALYGLGTGACIDWPDLSGTDRRIRIVRVKAPNEAMAERNAA